MQRDHAMQNGDIEKAAELSAQLAELEGPAAGDIDLTKRINDRNRAANREEVKRAEARSQEERRKISEALQRGDTSVKVDPSARVKTMPRLNYDRWARAFETLADVADELASAKQPTADSDSWNARQRHADAAQRCKCIVEPRRSAPERHTSRQGQQD